MPGQPRRKQQAPLSQLGNLPTENEANNDFQVQQLDTMSMMDQLTQELGEIVHVLLRPTVPYES